MEVDVLIAGDFRFPGGTSTSVISEVRALRAAGYRVGLMSVASRLLPATRAWHPGIRALVADGMAEVVAPGVPVSASLCCLHHPSAFADLPDVPPQVTCGEALLIVHHPPVDAEGTPQYSVARVRSVTEALFGRVTWAPVGPKVRAAFAALSSPPPLTRDDWSNVIDPEDVAADRARLPSAAPVIGRHSRPEAVKWPGDRTAFLGAYPDAPDVRVRLMGWTDALDEIVAPRPANWDVLPFGAMEVRDFLATLDYFSYFHRPDWIEGFGRAILEAMAVGLVCFLPPDFEALFGDAAIYCSPSEVLEHVRRLETDRSANAAQSARAREFVRRSFGPEVAVERVRRLIGPPAPARVAARPVRPANALYLTSNGVGMGHITRCMASARRLGPMCRPTIVTMSSAFEVARQHGITVEYMPFMRSVGLDHNTWAQKAKAEFAALFRYHRPDVFVFDGNVPYEPLVAALADVPAMWKVWQRRALWPPGVGATALADAAAFDAVLEPAEFAAPVDRGMTHRRRSEARIVPSIRFLDQAEALDRVTARTLIGLDPGRPAMLLQLGAGNNIDLRGTMAVLMDEIAGADRGGAGMQVVFARWRVSRPSYDLGPEIRVLDTFPIARFLNAFDCAVAMAGYNTFHENLAAGLPTLFTANDHPEQDEQWLRADYAALRGMALSARRTDHMGFRRELRALFDPKVRESIRERCRAAPMPNGAQAAADYIEGLALTRKTGGLAFDECALRW